MRGKGRPKASYYARRATQSDMALNAEFSTLADAVVQWLDNGNYAAFSDALEDLESEYFYEFGPLSADEPKDKRIAVLAGQYSAATKALSDFRLVGQLIEQRREMAMAELIATVSEPSSAPPLYWQKLIKRIQATGIVQTDVHPGSRALAEHVAAAIHSFNAGRGKPADETYGDLPIETWADLPREFAGFRLVEIDPDHPMLAMKRTIHTLPPSTDIGYYTIDQVAPAALHTREATYKRWISIIDAWAKRTNKKIDEQQSGVWAMLLAHRMREDNSKVAFLNRLLIESPWRRGGVVMIEVVEDDLPPEYR